MKKLIIWIVIFALLVSFNAVLLENRSFKGDITLENCREKLTATKHGIKADSIESARANTAAINRLISSAPDGSAIYSK